MNEAMLVIGGAGDLGRTRILPALSEIGVEADVVDPGVARGTPLRFARRAYTSLEDVKEIGRLLGVVVASPNDLHLRHARWAVERGLPCLCEKPAAHTLADGEAMLELTAAGNVPLLVSEHYLAKPPSRFLMANRAGLLRGTGPLEAVRGRILEPGAPASARSWLLNPDRAGGGVWIDTGIHLVTMLLGLLPDPPWVIRHAAAGGYDEGEGRAETHFSLVATCGAVDIRLEAGRGAGESAKDLELSGPGGTITLDWQTNEVTRRPGGETLLDGGGSPYGGYLELIEGFVEVCRAGRDAVNQAEPPLCSGLVPCSLAVRALRLVKSAYACAGMPPGLRAVMTR